MLFSLALILLLALVFSGLCKRLNLPGLLGMIFTGILIGPYGLDLLDKSILNISSELRTIALIIILLRAGLSLDFSDLKKIGKPAVFMAFLPATFEILAYFIFAPRILGLSTIDSLLLGSVIAAVSPAVVVPRMVNLIDKGYGTKKGVPQLIMAGASCDDVFVIVLFTSFLSMAKEGGGSFNFISLAKIPASIISGILIGILVGYLLYRIFEGFYERGSYIRNSIKLIIIIAVAFLLVSAEDVTGGYFSGLLAVIAMGLMIKDQSPDIVGNRLSEKLGKLWLAAQLILFVLLGAAVDVRYTLSAGLPALVMLALGLIFRSIGVYVSLLSSNFNSKERLFCILAYLPKATVQAAIGGVAMAHGLASGKLILSVSVLSILVTAPLGAWAIDGTYDKLLDYDGDKRIET